MPRVVISAPVKPTEDCDKVKQAIQNLFPDAHIERHKNGLVGKSDNLERFRDLLERQRIRDSARSFLSKGCQDRTFVFTLNKQAAYMDKVNFAIMPHPLGDITVSVESDDPPELVRYLTQKKR
jgi:predicted RNA binding protein with dsRBD fold (UPF0201 family)